MTEIAEMIIFIIVSIWLLATITALIIFTFIYLNKSENQEKEYIKTLTEHEKAIILNYKQTGKVIFKRKPKNERSKNTIQ